MLLALELSTGKARVAEESFETFPFSGFDQAEDYLRTALAVFGFDSSTVDELSVEAVIVFDSSHSCQLLRAVHEAATRLFRQPPTLIHADTAVCLSFLRHTVLALPVETHFCTFVERGNGVMATLWSKTADRLWPVTVAETSVQRFARDLEGLVPVEGNDVVFVHAPSCLATIQEVFPHANVQESHRLVGVLDGALWRADGHDSVRKLEPVSSSHRRYRIQCGDTTLLTVPSGETLPFTRQLDLPFDKLKNTKISLLEMDEIVCAAEVTPSSTAVRLHIDELGVGGLKVEQKSESEVQHKSPTSDPSPTPQNSTPSKPNEEAESDSEEWDLINQEDPAAQEHS